jgi:predicted GTPase
MPYGDLARQAVQRFATLEDLRRADCTIEEMEEYEPHVVQGDVVFAGVDYERILRRAEAEADAIVWDGGNNDLPFFVPDLEIVLVDPHRAGDERTYFPGEANLLRADVIVLTKLDTAEAAKVGAVRASIKAANPSATVVDSTMPLHVDQPDRIRGARVLVVEDGPTLTHGGMEYGAGVLAARRFGARELVDPRPHAVGSIAETFARHPHIGRLLPAMGYTREQVGELEATIRAAACDVVLIATPVDLRRLLRIDQPTCRVTYEFADIGHPSLAEVLSEFIAKAQQRG